MLNEVSSFSSTTYSGKEESEVIYSLLKLEWTSIILSCRINNELSIDQPEVS